jgi:hypothetical protein
LHYGDWDYVRLWVHSAVMAIGFDGLGCSKRSALGPGHLTSGLAKFSGIHLLHAREARCIISNVYQHLRDQCCRGGQQWLDCRRHVRFLTYLCRDGGAAESVFEHSVGVGIGRHSQDAIHFSGDAFQWSLSSGYQRQQHGLLHAGVSVGSTCDHTVPCGRFRWADWL